MDRRKMKHRCMGEAVLVNMEVKFKKYLESESGAYKCTETLWGDGWIS